MAQSKGFFGLRKGSTKSLTFSTLDGKQITKDRVYDVKNPRTESQMRQRMLMTTVGAAYKMLKSIADHSFEGYSSGMQCMRQFNSRNLNRFKQAAAAKGSVAFNEYKDGDINPLPFILASGSLPGFTYKFDAESNLEIVGEKENADFATAEGIYAALGVQRNDLITFCTVIGEGSISNGVYTYKAERFNIVRLYCDKSGAVTKPADAFTISTNNDQASIAMSTAANTITIISGKADFGAVIQSRKNDNGWLRSDAVMIVDDTVISGVKTANQLATYPVGTELILNNGPMANQGEATEVVPKPGVSPTSYTIDSGLTAQIGIKNPNKEAVTCTVTSGNSFCSVTNAGKITSTNTGETTENATIKVVIGTAEFTVNVTLLGKSSSGDGGGLE
jgi:hypothetical protein